VEQEDYTVVTNGGLWRDEHPGAPMQGHNQPPADDSFEGLREAIEEAWRDAEDALKGRPIENQDEANQIANLADRLAELHGKAKKLEAEEKRPVSDMLVEIARKWAPIMTRAETYKNLKIKLLTPWGKKVKQQNMEAAAAAAAEGMAVKAERPKMGTRGRAMSLKTIRTAKIVDYPKALEFFANSEDVRACVQKLANMAVRAGTNPPPGCEVVEDEKVV
jgi:hypothetical protein